MLRVLYFVVSVMIIALGVIHVAAMPRFFATLTSGAIWFASGGIAIMITGALNLLRRAYGEMAPGVRLVCVATNVVMTFVALLAGYASRASALQFALVVGLIGGATLLSLLPAAQKRTVAPTT